MDSPAFLIACGLFGLTCGSVGGYLMFIFPKRPLKPSTPTPIAPRFSYMESETASGGSLWHIRSIPAGQTQKFGGGITTSSLCGRIHRGWDLRSPVGWRRKDYVCQECARIHLDAKPQ